MKPDFVEYNGHGMIERHPTSMSQTYIVGHETRHRVHNRLQALSRGENVSQDTSYKVSLSSGSAVITKAVTRSQSDNNKNSSSSISLQVKNSLLPDSNISLRRSDLSALKKTKLAVEQKIRGLETVLKEGAGNSEKRGAEEIETKRVEKQRLQNKSTRLEKEISLLKGGVQLTKSNTEKEKRKTANSLPDISSPPKEDFSTLRELSQAINDSFIFMKRNVPGVLLQDGPGSALQTKNALQSLTSGREPTFFDTRFTFHSDFAGLRARDLKAFESRLARLDKAAGILVNRENFKIKKASTSDPEAISLKTSFASPEGNFSLSVNELAKGEKIVSREFQTPFASLNLSGSFTLDVQVFLF